MLAHFSRMKGFSELMLMQQWSVTNKCGALRSNFAIVALGSRKIEDDFLIAICTATKKNAQKVVITKSSFYYRLAATVLI